MIIVDTSVWIDFFNGQNTAAVSLLEQLITAKKALCINGIIEMEILQGIRDNKTYNLTKHYLQAFLRFQDCNYSYIEKATDIYRQCRTKGITIRKSVDCLIAANALIENLIILHQERDFAQIKEAIPELGLLT